MMKCEFEEMIGKEVSFETFKEYEEMYMALPETYTKTQFIAMLNIKAIPESKEAVARREKNEQKINEIKEKINKLKADIKEKQNEIENIKSWIKSGDKDGYWKRELKWRKKHVNLKKNEINALKFIIS